MIMAKSERGNPKEDVPGWRSRVSGHKKGNGPKAP